jgi:hypothetical protein
MNYYRVKSDYVRGLWDANHRGPAVVTVRAMNAEEAAMPRLRWTASERRRAV